MDDAPGRGARPADQSAAEALDDAAAQRSGATCEALLNARRRWRSWPSRAAGAGDLADRLRHPATSPPAPSTTRRSATSCAARSRTRSAASSRASSRARCSCSTATTRSTATLRLRIEALLRADPAPEPSASTRLLDAARDEVSRARDRRGPDVSDALLPYYDRELDALRRLAAEFAEAHPKIAGRLRLSADTVDDPHVARLLEGVAFLAARVHHRLDDEFPELTDALLERPLPALPRARSRPLRRPLRSPSRSCTHAGAASSAGLAVETEPVRGERCRYRTAYADDALAGRDRGGAAVGPAADGAGQPAGRGRASRACGITLKCISPDVSFAQARHRPAAPVPARRRQCGAAAARAALRACRVGRLCRRAGRPAAGDPAGPTRSSRSASRRTRRCCPGRARAFAGFRLLTEYFALPGKVPVPRPQPDGSQGAAGDGNRLEIFIYSRPRRAGARALGRRRDACARLHAARQPVPAALRADPPRRTRRSTTASCPMRAARRPSRYGRSSRVRETDARRQLAALAARSTG